MKIKPLIIALSVALALPLLSGHPLAMAEGAKPPPMSKVSKESIESRIDNLTRLVTASSGAKRIKDSGKEAAMAQRDHAEELLNNATALFNDGDYTEANRLLGQVTVEMFKAIRMVGDEEATNRKKKSDFEARAASVDILVKALERIAKEKGREAKMAATFADIEAEVTEARGLMANGDMDGARKMMDTAYVQAKTAVDSLRDGDTLVRSLNFATKEEEYHYELDRNDTHKMLVKVLLEEKISKSPYIKKNVETFTAKAEALRLQAEGEAGNAGFAQAVELLEQSTKELVRAIRSAGVYIPG